MNMDEDVNNIVYANNKSKLTLKTKIILENLATQVAQWEIEDWRTNYNSPKHINTSRKTKELSQDIFKTPNKRLTLRNPEFRANISGNVKQRVQLFEGIHNTATPELKLQPPKRKLLEVSSAIENLNTSNFSSFNSYNQSISKISGNNTSVCELDSSLLNEENKENFHSEDFFLPPPPIVATPLNSSGEEEDIHAESSEHAVSNYSECEDCEFTDKEFTENDSVVSSELECATQDSEENRESFTDVSTLYEESDMFKEIMENLNQAPIISTIKSNDFVFPSPIAHVQPTKKLRRSLSFNDRVEVIPDSSPAHSSNDSEIEEEVAALEDNYFSEASELDETFHNVTISSHTEMDTEKLEEEKVRIKKILIKKMDILSNVLTRPDVQFGSKEHADASRAIVEYHIRAKMVEYKLKFGQPKPAILEGFLTLSNLKLQLKSGWAVVDTNQLSASKKWSKIKVIHHILVYVYSKTQPEFYESEMISIMPIEDAKRIGIEHVVFYRLRIFEQIEFVHVQPRCKLVFEVYSMRVHPAEDYARFKQSTKRSTPFSKMIMSRCSSVDKVNNKSSAPFVGRTGVNSERNFTSITSFTLGCDGMRPEASYYSDRISLTQDSIFTGEVDVTATMRLRMAQSVDGKLNIYNDVGGVGSWSYYTVKMTSDGLYGQSTESQSLVAAGVPTGGTSRRSADYIFVPYQLMQDEADLCEYHVCAKPNSFCVSLRQPLSSPEPSMELQKMMLPVNKRRSVDGRQKHRFLAEAPSDREAEKWCSMINCILAAYRVITTETDDI